MGPLFQPQTLENFFISLSLPKTQWFHCCGKHWKDHCSDTSTSEPYTTPRTGFTRSHFILSFICFFVLPIDCKDAFSMKLRRSVGSSLVYMDFTTAVIMFIYFKENVWDQHGAEIFSSPSLQLSHPGSLETTMSPSWTPEIPYSVSSPTLHFDEPQSVHRAALELCTLTMSQVNCQETK